MNDRTTARIVGGLFIVASVTAIVGGVLVLPTVGDDRLLGVADHQNQIVTGALLEIVLAMSAIGIAAMLFPIVKRRDEGLALCFVGARTLEGVFILGSTIASLSILSLGRDYRLDGATGVELMGDTLIVAKEWSYGVAMVSFAVSAMILNALLLRAGLVPSWLSVPGFVGGFMFLVRIVMEMYGREFTPVVMGVSTAPIGISEMVLAGWLIAKGFLTVPGDSGLEDAEVSTLLS